MIQDIFLDCILIVSSEYKQLCKLEKTYYNDNQKIIDIKLAQTIIDQLINNGKEKNKIPKILLLGGDTENAWPISKEIINYIRQFNYNLDITFQIENKVSIDLLEQELQFLKNNNIIINCIYNAFTKSILSLIYQYDNYFNLKIIINADNFTKIETFYKELAEKYQFLKLEFLFNYNSLTTIGNRININIINQQLLNISHMIHDSFNNNIVPLIPLNFIDNLLNSYILYEQNRLNIQYFSDSYNIKTYCNILNGVKIIVNQDGELFLCSCYQLDKNNNMYCGKINDNQFIENDNLNIINKIYNVNDFSDLKKKERCQICEISSICQLGCFSNNLLNTNDSLLPAKLFCTINQQLQKIIEQLMLQLDQEKNELFKTYFYITCQQGRPVQ